MATAPPSPVPSVPTFERLLLTGAAGGLGRVLRPRLKRLCRVLRASDIAAMDPAGEGEEVVVAPLEDAAAVLALVAGVEAIVHLGGISVEGPFQPILQANIVGVHNLYEAARKHGVRRVVFASSNHVTGFYRQDEVVRPRRSDAARRPLRPEQGVRREPVALLLRPLRPGDGVPAHRLVVPRAEGPAHARHLAELRRSRAPRGGQPDRAGGRTQRRSTASPTTARAGGTTPRRRTSAIAPRTAPSRFAPPPRHASRSST